MEAFCGDSVFWNTTATWGNNATYPEFSTCFQNTVLLWIPPGWLVLSSLFYLPHLLSKKTDTLPNSWKSLSKLCLTVLQLVLVVIVMSHVTEDLNKNGGKYWQASFLGPIIEIVALLLVLLLLELERRKGFITSGVLFIYWVLANIIYVVPLYTGIIQKQYDSDPLIFITFIVYYIFSLLQLVLSCIAETLPPTEGKQQCPEMRSSFLSRTTFHWIQGLVVAGYRKTLTEADMFYLNPRDQSRNVMENFGSNWRAEEIKQRIKKQTEDRKKVLVEADGTSERTPLIGSHSTNSVSYTESHDTTNQSQNTSKDEIKVSLIKVLWKSFGFEYLVANIWKLFYDGAVFANPLLLRQLIDFTGDFTQPDWKGYVYCVGFLCVLVVQSFAFHQLMYQTTSLGLRLRCALIGAVYKKSMRMNNQARTESTAGEIVNLMSVDTEHIRDVTGYIWGLWSSPLQITLSLTLLYYTVGYAMFAGLGVLVFTIPMNGLIMAKFQKQQVILMAQKDQRLKLMTEILNGIKILKLYAWELAFGEKVTAVRQKELAALRRASIIMSFMTFTWTVAPFMVGLATFATYIFAEKDHRIDAQTAFVAMTLFNILRFAVVMFPYIVMEVIKAAVSVKRMDKFLNHADLDSSNVTHHQSDNAVSIENGTFSWDPKLGPCLKNIKLSVPKGSLVAVVGTVGAGKSSLVSAILGEMEKNTGTVNVDGSTAYVPQQAWIQNATVQDNILFGNLHDKTGYDNIIEACALQSDLDILPAGDMTEIGEKGINLSGGQRQRVSLARAVYFDSDIYLLDDPLSAVDSHVGKHIFEKVIGKEGLLKDKTRVLVTHGIQWLPSVDIIVVISNGGISEVGSYDELLQHDGDFATFLKTYLIELESEGDEEEDDDEIKKIKAMTLQRLVSIQSDGATSEGELMDKIKQKRMREDSESDSSKPKLGRQMSRQDTIKESEKEKDKKEDGEKAKLIEEEEVEQGNVSWNVFMSYARAIGIKSAFFIVILYGSYHVVAVFASIWLTNWTSDPDLQNLTKWPANSTDRQHKNSYYLGVYGGLGVAQGALVLSYACIAILGMIHAAKILHHKMLINVLRGPMSFFDTTPVGRIVNRFSQDVNAVDAELPNKIENFLDCLFNVLATFIVISYSTPIFLTVLLPLGIMYTFIQRFYIPTSRQLRRLDSKTRSPIYNNFSESLTGSCVIRAFKVEDRFMQESEERVDHNQEYAFAGYTVNRWLGFRLEMLGGIVILGASVFAVLEKENISSAVAGLSVSYALQITDNLNWLVRMVGEMETNIVSVERLEQYSANPTEAAVVTSHRPDNNWPDQGRVEMKSYSTRYREGLDLVLKNIHVSINPGEKVGIVGRTGAGKSSLTLALFRLIEPANGRIIIDGEDVSHLGLYDLRSRLTILPQEPVLFSGTLRLNLDPLDQHSDPALWTALEHAHLKSFVDGLPEKLEYECGEGGQNLSVGQRQLMCLARSLLRKSKVLILDEATAAVDLETDALIQNTINVEFSDCTVLTIAHRLNTVMDYDRILVLSEGEVKEFDTPQTLLQNQQSIFHGMAKDAGLV